MSHLCTRRGEHWFMTPNSKILVKMLTVMTNDLMPNFKILPDAPRSLCIRE